MGKSSSNLNEIISLPKGGGSLSGLGEKFSPDLFTGTGNFSVPVALPPGRNDFHPELKLVYSTGHGAGPFGLGWALSIPGVSRKTSKGVPRYDDARDVFILSGAEDLVPVQEEGQKTRYRPCTEGLFAGIIHHKGDQDDYWEVRTKDGLVSLYGTPGAAGNDPATLADPVDRSRIFAWKLSETRDPFGNRIRYEYQRKDGSAGLRQWDELYLSRIRYVDYTDDQGDEQFLVSVSFHYEALPERYADDVHDCRRIYPSSDHRAGFEIRTGSRCTRIDIHTHAGENRLVRSYGLIYLDQRQDLQDLGERLPRNGLPLLSQIQVTGHDGDDTQSLPPLEFDYSVFQPQERRFSRLQGHDLPARSLAHPDLELADLFGNGLPDFVELNGLPRYWRNLGHGRFDLPRSMSQLPAEHSLAEPGVQLIDANGNGRIDLLISRNGRAGYYPSRFGGCWDSKSFQPYRFAPSFGLEDPEVRLVDLSGNGVTDAIRSGTQLECYFNDPKDGWTSTRRVPRRQLAAFPNVSFSDPRVRWADLSGDGLQDITLIHNGHVAYWPNLGHGDWAPRRSMRNSPRLPLGYDPRRVLLGDLDGDGLADMVFVGDTRVTLWINQGGYGWSDPITILGTPPVSDLDAVRLVDVLGTGVQGILWSRDATATTLGANHFFLDLTGGVKPYLLDEMDNHMGALTRVGYGPSTRFYLEDEAQRERRWQTPLPFPVQVVARVEVVDAISGGKLTTEYGYHHGYWDGEEREFRGFGRVDQRDTEVFADYQSPGLFPEEPFTQVAGRQFSLPLETRTWFHQGAVDDPEEGWREPDYSAEYWPGDAQLLARSQDTTDPLKGLLPEGRRQALRALRGSILRTELYALDGSARQERPYTVAESLHGLREEEPPSRKEQGRRRIFFPHGLAQRTTQWERGDDPMTQVIFTEDYDDRGQPQTSIQIACPRGWRTLGDTPAERFLATVTQTEYGHSVDPDWAIHDRVSKETTWEICYEGSLSMGQVKALANQEDALSPVVEQINFYDGPAFAGLPYGQVGKYGALVRTETLILTEKILEAAYTLDGELHLPPYLNADPVLPWPSEYPRAFRELLPGQSSTDSTRPGLKITPVCYGIADDSTGPPFQPGYYAASVRRCYDFHDTAAGKPRGLLMAFRDPLGQETRIAHDGYSFLPVRVVDPAGLATDAAYDYRAFQPNQVTGPNGNRTAYRYMPLGLLSSEAKLGREGEMVGDLLPDTPGTRYEYDLTAFSERQLPVSVRTTRRVHHASDRDVPAGERDAIISSVEYSDGFGREIQTRALAEDLQYGHPRWGAGTLPADQSRANETQATVVGRRRAVNDPDNVVVSGWQVYDNKGRVVEKFEPFFDQGWDYNPGDAVLGQSVTMAYDPRGQVIRTTNPDGSERTVLHGRPQDMAAPSQFAPSPWETYTYDENDNAGRTHSQQAQAYAAHWDTPSSVAVDGLGRVVASTERNGPDSAADWPTTKTDYDIRGNPLQVTDALGRRAFGYACDLRPKEEEEDDTEEKRLPPLRIEQVDGGVRRMFFDAAGNEIERRDAKQAFVLRAYDTLGRPLSLWARDGEGEAVTLREKLVYGDDGQAEGLTQGTARANNLLGRLYRHYDEAGRLTFQAYDFKGNPTEKTRQVLGLDSIRAAFDPPPQDWEVEVSRVDWQPPPRTTWQDHVENLLDSASYLVLLRYDALNRPREVQYPQDVEGRRRVLQTTYNRAGDLKQVRLDGELYVQHIAYNAKGQRTLVALGNGVLTRYAYDPKTFRLARLRSEGYAVLPGNQGYQPQGTVLQDMAYGHDLAGNIRQIRHREPDCGIPGTAQGQGALDRSFEYDPIYRLISATGRETDILPVSPWDASPRSSDLTRARAYAEAYRYDPLGNLLVLDHRAANGGSYRRSYALAAGANRLAAMQERGETYRYAYDASGNMIQENSERHFEWDHSDRLRVFRTQTAGAEPSVYAHYLYDSAGQRVMKVVRKQGGRLELTVYVDDLFEHHRLVQAGVTKENNSLHVLDGEARIALVRSGSPLNGDTSPSLTYHLADHLGSSNVLVNGQGSWVNREEFLPYGETSFGGHARKRFRFTGKERDEESGLGYWVARYFAPHLGRFQSLDPIDMGDSYIYAAGNPLANVDPDGRIPVAVAAVYVLMSPVVLWLIGAMATHGPRLIRLARAAATWTARMGPVLAQWADKGKQLLQRNVAMAQRAYLAALPVIQNALRGMSNIAKDAADKLARAFAYYAQEVHSRLQGLSVTVRERMIRLHFSRMGGPVLRFMQGLAEAWSGYIGPPFPPSSIWEGAGFIYGGREVYGGLLWNLGNALIAPRVLPPALSGAPLSLQFQTGRDVGTGNLESVPDLPDMKKVEQLLLKGISPQRRRQQRNYTPIVNSCPVPSVQKNQNQP